MKFTSFRKGLALMVALVLLLTVTACAPKSTVETAPVETSAPNESITLIDQAGREVTLDEPAQTLVSCYYITTYATIALGISDRVVGLEKKADTRAIYHMATPDLLKKTQVGTLKEFNVEATAALEPDLVLMPVKLASHADTLTELGIPVLVVNPESQEMMEQMLTLIAKACGVEDRAESLIAYYAEKLEMIAELTKDTDTPNVYMAGNSSYLTTAPGAMYQSNLITLAGGANVVGDMAGDYWTEVSYETILTANPEVIIIPSGASYTAEDIMADQNLSDVAAVQNGAIYQMPQKLEEWDSPIPSGILGAMWLTSVLHDDVYPFDAFQKDAADFYRNFYGFEVDQTLITK